MNKEPSINYILSLSNSFFALTKSAGMFEAPPAMIKSIGRWTAHLYASQVLYNVERNIRAIQLKANPESANDQLSQELQYIENAKDKILLDIKNLKKNKNLRYKIFERKTLKGIPKSHFIGIKKSDYYKNPENPDALIVLTNPSNEEKYLPLYMIGSGKNKLDFPHFLNKTTKMNLFSAEEIADIISKELQQSIENLNSFKDRTQEIKPSELTDYQKTDLVNLILLKKECLKFTNQPKQYKTTVTRVFPVDLDGWKYTEGNKAQPLIKKVNKKIQEENEKTNSYINNINERLDLAQKAFDLSNRSGKKDFEALNEEDYDKFKNLVNKISDLYNESRKINGLWSDNLSHMHHFIDDNIRPSLENVKIYSSDNDDNSIETSAKDLSKNIKNPVSTFEEAVDTFPHWPNLKNITVDINFTQRETIAGTWIPDSRRLTLDLKDSEISTVREFYNNLNGVLNYLRHELQHFGQTALDIIRQIGHHGKESGTVSKKIKETYNIKPETSNQEQPKFSKQNLDDLEEYELYPRLNDQVYFFMNKAKNRGLHTSQMYKDLFDQTTYLKDNSSRELALIDGRRKIDTVEDFFFILKHKQPAKWKKAVSEFYKMLNEKGYEF